MHCNRHTQVFETTILALGMSMFIARRKLCRFSALHRSNHCASKIDQVLDKFGYSAGGKMGNILPEKPKCLWLFMPDPYLSRGVLWRNSIRKNIYTPDMPIPVTIKGLYIYEWMIAIGGLSVCMFVFSYIGLVYGLMLDRSCVYRMCARWRESRQNHLMQVISIIQFSLSQKIYIKGKREDIELQKEKEENKKKRKNKEKKPKKKKNKEKRKKRCNLTFFRFWKFEKIRYIWKMDPYMLFYD